MNFAEEQINKAKTVKSAEELLELAKANGVELTEEQAKAYFVELHREGELTDEELSTIAGGKGEPESLYHINDYVEYAGIMGSVNVWLVKDMSYNWNENRWYYNLEHNGFKAFVAEDSIIRKVGTAAI